MTTYSDKLNTKEWADKRLKVFKRDGFKCTACGSDSNLNAHHTFYFKNHPDPWLYPLSSIITLCEKCHYDYHYHHEIDIIDPVKIVKPKRKPKYKNSYKAEIISGKKIRVVTVTAKDMNTAKIKLQNRGIKVINIKQAPKTANC